MQVKIPHITITSLDVTELLKVNHFANTVERGGNAHCFVTKEEGSCSYRALIDMGILQKTSKISFFLLV